LTGALSITEFGSFKISDEFVGDEQITGTSPANLIENW
jgi:hypothetical protein